MSNNDLERAKQITERFKVASDKILKGQLTKDKLRRVKSQAKSMIKELHEIQNGMPLLQPKIILRHMRNNTVESHSGIKVCRLLHKDLQAKFEHYEQDISSIIAKLVEDKKIFKNRYSYAEERGPLSVISQRNLYVFKEADLKNSYKIDGIIYSTVNCFKVNK